MSRAPPPAEILAVGLVTPVGLDAPSAAAALRAGVSRVKASSVHNGSLEPHRMAVVPADALPPLAAPIVGARSSAHARLLRLAAPALQQVLGVAVPDPVALHLGLPEAPPDEPDPVGESFLLDLVAQADAAASVLIPASTLHREGGAAGLFALRAALDGLASGAADVAVVGGVDTFLDLRRLARLDAEGRVLGDRVMDGFVPGEGAAMLLVATPDGAARLGRAPLARVLSAATGSEPGHRYSHEPYRGDGLAATFQGLFAAAPSAPPVGCAYAGFNGESLPAKEWGVAYLRNSERFAKDCRVEHPADCIGDAGAALGPLMLALAAVGISRGYRRSPCLVWTTSDREPRAAALIASAT